MFPFGPKLNTVFASRWKALVWADGTVQYAVSIMPPAHSSAFQRLAKTVFILGPNGIIAAG